MPERTGDNERIDDNRGGTMKGQSDALLGVFGLILCAGFLFLFLGWVNRCDEVLKPNIYHITTPTANYTCDSILTYSDYIYCEGGKDDGFIIGGDYAVRDVRCHGE